MSTSASFSSLSSSIIARQIARVSRPRPWIVPALVVNPAPVACSTTVPSSTFSSLPKSTIARVTARVSRPQPLSTVSSYASSKRPIVVGRQSPVSESGLRQTTLAARASARASRDRPWLSQRPSIAAKVSQSKCKTSQWIKSQAVDLRQALRRPPQASRQPSSTSLRHSPTSDASVSFHPPPIVLPKRRPAAIDRQPVRYPSTSNKRPALPLSSRPQQVVSPASPDNSIAAIVREAFAFDINEFRAEVETLNDKIASHHKWLRRLNRKPVTFDDNPAVMEVPRWIEKEHVHPRPPRCMGQLLAWQPLGDSNPYEHTLTWGTDSDNFDHSDCENPGCHRRAKDLYMLADYEEWTAPTFTTISE